MMTSFGGEHVHNFRMLQAHIPFSGDGNYFPPSSNKFEFQRSNLQTRIAGLADLHVHTTVSLPEHHGNLGDILALRPRARGEARASCIMNLVFYCVICRRRGLQAECDDCGNFGTSLGRASCQFPGSQPSGKSSPIASEEVDEQRIGRRATSKAPFAAVSPYHSRKTKQNKTGKYCQVRTVQNSTRSVCS